VAAGAPPSQGAPAGGSVVPWVWCLYAAAGDCSLEHLDRRPGIPAAVGQSAGRPDDRESPEHV